MKATLTSLLTLVILILLAGCHPGPDGENKAGIFDANHIPDPYAMEGETLQVMKADSLSTTKVLLHFNKAVTEKSMETYTNYTIVAESGTECRVTFASAQSSLTVELSIAPPLIAGETYTIYANNILTEDEGDPIGEKNYAIFTAQDTDVDEICPTVLAAESLHSTAVKIRYSEPMDAASVLNPLNYSILYDGGKLTVDSVTTTGNPVEYLISTDTQLPLEYTVIVSSMFDEAENLICEPYSATFEGTNVDDEIAPYIANVQVMSNTTLVVTFSESMNLDGLEEMANYSISGLQIISVSTLDGSNQLAVLTTEPMEDIEYLLTILNIQDTVGNEIGSPNTWTFQGTEEVDLTPPAITNVRALDNTTVSVSFTKPVDKTVAETESIYSITGLSISEALRNESNPSKVILTTGSQTDQEYMLNVTGIKDTDGNVATGTLQSAFYGDAVPCLFNVVAVHESSTKVEFTEGVSTTALTAANYIEEDSNFTVVDVTRDGSDSSIVWLTHTPYTGQIQLTLIVSNIEDENGNEVGSSAICNEFDFTGNGIADPDPPVIDTVVTLSPTEIMVVFNELLDETSANEISNYSISPSLAVVDAELDTWSTKRRVYIETAPQSEVAYTISAVGVKDKANNDSDTSGAFDGDGIPCLDSVTPTDNNSITLDFTEPVVLNLAQNTLNYAISGLTIISAERDTTNHDIVYLGTSNQIEDFEYTITVSNLKDYTGNLIGSTCNELTFDGLPDVTPPKVLVAYAIDEQTIEVVFNEPVTTTAEDVDAYSCMALPLFSATLQGDPRKVRINTHYQSDQYYTLTVSDIVEDIVGNKCVAPYHEALFKGGGDPAFMYDDFSSYSDIGELQPPWDIQGSGGDWRVDNEAVTNMNNDNRTYFVNTNQPVTGDYWMEVHLASYDDDTFGIVWNYANNNDHYWLDWYIQNFTRLRVVERGGSGDMTGNLNIPYVIGQMYTIRISMEGNQIRFFLDGDEIATITDNSRRTGTGYGFYSTYSAGSTFYDIRVHTID
jgi:hypothetical protein